MVGDDLDEDYISSKEAGLQAVLLTRDSREADWVRRDVLSKELDQIEFITSLSQLSELVKRYNVLTTD